MKKTFFILLLCFAYNVNAQQTMLPDELKSFVLENFEGQSIRLISQSEKYPKLKQVTMEDNSIFLYNAKKIVVGITLNNDEKSLEQQFAQPVKDYLRENYSESRVVSWFADKKKEYLELHNGTKLIFSVKDHILLGKENDVEN